MPIAEENSQISAQERRYKAIAAYRAQVWAGQQMAMANRSGSALWPFVKALAAFLLVLAVAAVVSNITS